MIIAAVGRGALRDGKGLDGKSRLCEHTLSLMSDSSHLAFDRAA